ncbi:MAG: FAD:protein FMN transferase [Planctomycetota bacterium]
MRFVLLLLVALTAGCGAKTERFVFHRGAMGTVARIVLYAGDAASADAAAEAAFDRIAALEGVMSDYREDSELMQLCAQAGGGAVEVSDDLFRVLTRAQGISADTAGAFDVTVGPLVRLWRRARTSGVLPDDAAIAAARRRVGWAYVDLVPVGSRVTLARSGMRLDLGGIGKGFAAEEALRELENHGIRSALVDVGGDLVLGAAPPNADGWRVSIGVEGLPHVLSECAVGVSGDTEQYVEIDGVRYSHVLDPRTGVGLATGVRVTVIAADGAEADALASALSVLGVERALDFAELRDGVEALIEVPAAGGIDRRATAGFPAPHPE